jgi:hypothetical protein
VTVGRFLVGAQEGENRRRHALIVVGRDWAGKGAGGSLKEKGDLGKGNKKKEENKIELKQEEVLYMK